LELIKEKIMIELFMVQRKVFKHILKEYIQKKQYKDIIAKAEDERFENTIIKS
jgi:hypothetical protein